MSPFKLKFSSTIGGFSTLAFARNALCFFHGYAFFSCNQMLGSHALFDLLGIIFLKFQITVCDDSNKLFTLSDRNTGNAEFAISSSASFNVCSGDK